MVETDESTVRIILRRIVAPILVGLAIGWLVQALIPWQVIVAVVAVGTPIYVVHELRWVRRQQRRMREQRARIDEFIAHYDRRRHS